MTDGVAIEPRLENLEGLLAVSKQIRAALGNAGITGPQGEKIDHVELYGKPEHPAAQSRNFVLCPGNAYDRAPCGTGTSAKMAALHQKGLLGLGEKWVQESVTGSLYEGHLLEREGALIPVIRAAAHVTARATLYFDSRDPFRGGIGKPA
jgi:4-hydroxyproline epimerase